MACQGQAVESKGARSSPPTMPGGGNTRPASAHGAAKDKAAAKAGPNRKSARENMPDLPYMKQASTPDPPIRSAMVYILLEGRGRLNSTAPRPV
ncbi:hypothetical protein MishRS11D_03420 [Methylomagnum ishizawai]|nr:hypothetical protein MishRS11D_03420 [Methylomagnum ishizawai]